MDRPKLYNPVKANSYKRFWLYNQIGNELHMPLICLIFKPKYTLSYMIEKLG